MYRWSNFYVNIIVNSMRWGHKMRVFYYSGLLDCWTISHRDIENRIPPKGLERLFDAGTKLSSIQSPVQTWHGIIIVTRMLFFRSRHRSLKRWRRFLFVSGAACRSNSTTKEVERRKKRATQLFSFVCFVSFFVSFNKQRSFVFQIYKILFCFNRLVILLRFSSKKRWDLTSPFQPFRKGIALRSLWIRVLSFFDKIPTRALLLSTM